MEFKPLHGYPSHIDTPPSLVLYTCKYWTYKISFGALVKEDCHPSLSI